ncbi:MAG TPA: hypothetical protein VGB83_05810 [Actinomycetota bacterium]
MRRIVAVASLLAAAACTSGGSLVQDQPPRGADELLLRVAYEGGFTPPEYQVIRMPIVSVFGDGRVVTEGPQIEIYPSPALPSVVVRTVSEDAVELILDRAREAGLTGPDRELTNDTIADAADTVFTVDYGDETHTTRAYALGFDDDAERAALTKFQNDMTDLASWLPAEDLGEESEWEIDRLRIAVQDYAGDPEVPQGAKDWPLATPLASFGQETAFGIRCGAVEGEDLATLLPEVRSSNQLTPWTSDGKDFRLNVRPLLPDEPDC